MIAGYIAIAVFAALALCYVLNSRRPLSERVVDCLYRFASFTYAVAQAADSALCRYRSARQEIRESHVPMYAEVR